MRLIALCGSTRRHSLNARLLDAASACAPPGLQIVHASPLATLPHLDEDTEADAWREGPVAELARAVRASDGLLIATPEYNQSIPGVLKNALDWLSRHPQPGLLEGRRAALMGATVGPWGTRLAQAHLRHVLGVVGVTVVARPLLVADAGRRWTDGGWDPGVQAQLHAWVGSLAAGWRPG